MMHCFGVLILELVSLIRYIFIFLWTPALTSIQRKIQLRDNTNPTENEQQLKDPHGDADELPFGWIFSSFMVCCMLGTMTFSYLINAGVSASKSLIWILALSAISCLAMAVPFTIQSNCRSGANSIQYAGMLLYEFCIGAYFPAIGTVKGAIVPEDKRAAIYNVFRLPLNLMVLLYLVGDFNTESSFIANALMLVVACILQVRIVRGAVHEHSK
jgi:MFS family permease